MAFSPLRSKKALLNGRSLSLPSKLQHPAVSDFNESLSKIVTPSSAENRLSGLKILYRKIDDLLALPHTQQLMISQQGHEELTNDRVLDAYIRILDACDTTRDIVSQTKHDVQQLLSALRRKDVVNGIRSYQASRKTSRKSIQKALRELRIGFKSSKQKDQENCTLAVVYMMIKEAESVTVAMFKFWLSYVIMDKEAGPSRKSSWLSLVLKRSKKVEIDPSRLKEKESNIRLLEEELESLFRQLIKTRVSLLNILNH